MRFYAETLLFSVVAGVLYAFSWWAQDELGVGAGELDVYQLGFAFGAGLALGLVVSRQRLKRALAELSDENLRTLASSLKDPS